MTSQRAAIEIVGCDVNDGWTNGEEHDGLSTNAHTLKEYSTCGGTAHDQVTVKIAHWKDDCSPIWKYYLNWCPMRPLNTMNEYAGMNAHTGRAYCGQSNTHIYSIYIRCIHESDSKACNPKQVCNQKPNLVYDRLIKQLI